MPRQSGFAHFFILAVASVIAILVAVALSSNWDLKNKLFPGIFPKKGSEAGIYPKGVNWHMGAWYNATAGISGYNWDGLKKDLNDMKAGDITWVRFSFGSHTQTSCSSTGYYSSIANELDQRGMKGLPTIYIPNNKTTTASDSEVASYTSWLNTMVNCYKSRFGYYEVWNEPNLHYYWNIDENTTDTTAYANSVSYYVKYLKATYQTIKAIDPNLKVVLGGLAQWKDERFMDELTRQAAGQYFDILAFHPYSEVGPDGVITELNSLKSKMAADPMMAGKPIWVTELGYTTGTSGPGHVSSEEIKADYLKQSYEKLVANGITEFPIMWYDWDHDTCTNCGSGYGLIYTERSQSPYTTTYHPAYYTLRDLWKTPTPAPTSASAGVNLLQNSTFESGLSPWYIVVKTGATGTVSQDNTTKVNGSYSAKVNITQSNPTNWYLQWGHKNLSLTAGQPYTVTFYAKASQARSASVMIQKNASPFTEYFNQTFNLTTSWQKFTYTYNATTNDSSVWLAFNLANASGQVWFDDVMLCKGSCGAGPITIPTLTPIPTSTSTAINTPIPTPTASASSVIPNLLTNYSYEAGISPWVWLTKSRAKGSVVKDTGTYAIGSASAKVNITNSDNKDWYLQLGQKGLSMNSGQTYTISFYAKASKDRSLSIIIQQDYAPYKEYFNTKLSLNTSWQKFKYTYKPDVTDKKIWIAFNLAETIGQVWIDDVYFCPGTCNTP
jgi:hypothetical protein